MGALQCTFVQIPVLTNRALLGLLVVFSSWKRPGHRSQKWFQEIFTWHYFLLSTSGGFPLTYPQSAEALFGRGAGIAPRPLPLQPSLETPRARRARGARRTGGRERRSRGVGGEVGGGRRFFGITDLAGCRGWATGGPWMMAFQFAVTTGEKTWRVYNFV